MMTQMNDTSTDYISTDYVSIRGQTDPVGFDRAVLEGFAPDGGLFVPRHLPVFSSAELAGMQQMPYPDLALSILSRFIPGDLIPPGDLSRIIQESFKDFTHPDILPLIPCPGMDRTWILELFHGPTLSFKDIAMGVLIRIMDYFLEKTGQQLNLVLATTGDTGPAAAHAAAGLKHLTCWPLFPAGMITLEQQAQMTCLTAPNIHPVGVERCPDGGDDLDRVVLSLFSSPAQRKALQLSSVNSINWCRVMVQSVHYFFAYFRVCWAVGEPMTFSIPSGAVGNLFAGMLAREMGLPLQFICAVNANQTLYRLFTTGVFSPRDLIPTCSSAIDIVLPYNVWRLLYFVCGRDSDQLRFWMDEFQAKGEFTLPPDILKRLQDMIRVTSISDARTLATMAELHKAGCLPDPHAAVAIAGAKAFYEKTESPMVCLATAHPAKFPDVVKNALGLGKTAPLPPAARHPALDRAMAMPPNLTTCGLEELEPWLVRAMTDVVTARKHDI